MREHEKLPVIVIKLRMNVYSDTKCRLVPIKLRVVRLPRIRLSGVMSRIVEEGFAPRVIIE